MSQYADDTFLILYTSASHIFIFNALSLINTSINFLKMITGLSQKQKWYDHWICFTMF